MNNLLLYLLKVSIITGVLYIPYRLFFAGNPFHNLNRFLLLGIVLFSLVCPVLQIGSSFINSVPALRILPDEFAGFSEPGQTGTTRDEPLNRFPLVFYPGIIYLAGTVFFFIRFIRQLYRLVLIRRSALSFSNEKFTFYYTENFSAPFSFFNMIFLPTHYLEFPGRELVLEHEMAHSKQLHSLDLVVSEIFCIAFWFNPFVFLLKKSLKTCHEYLADRAVIGRNCSPADYLGILLSSTHLACTSGITNHFNSLTIKKRIEMITNTNIPKSGKLPYLILLPLLILLIQAFSVFSTADNPPKICPVKGGEISWEFGVKDRNPITKKIVTHAGIDIKAALGTMVVSSASGVVIKAEEDEAYGKLVIIRHDEHFETWYAHLNDYNVKTGDKVSAGQEIAHVGTTGYSTGPHLHFEVRKDGEKQNPSDYFETGMPAK